MSKLKFRVECNEAGWYAFGLGDGPKRYLHTDGSLKEWTFSNNDTIYFKDRNTVEWAIVNFNNPEGEVFVKEEKPCVSLVELLSPEPITRPMTAQEIAMLPRGTKFHFYQDDNEDVFVYNPVINKKGIWGSNLEGKVITKNFNELRGYQLPDEEEIRPFTVDTSPLTTEEILKEVSGRG